MAAKRILRVPVSHLTVFERILAGLREAQGTLRSHGSDWRLVSDEDGVRIYERADFGLDWLRETVREYERALYGVLATAIVGRDNSLHRRTTKVAKDRGGVYRRRRLD